MQHTEFYISDVFGIKKYSGNQLATFTNCSHLTDKEMQQRAAEINFSETTFIFSGKKENGGYDVRIFTPKTEVDFAGHPALGTAFLINKIFENNKADIIRLNLKVGQIPVSFDGDIMFMQQIEPQFGKIYDRKLMAGILSLSASDLDEKFPIQHVNTGIPFAIVPLKSMEVLKKSRVDLKLYSDFCAHSDAKAILVFCRGGYKKDQSIAVRVFVPFFGITEDAATGSGSGCLAGYLVNTKYFGSESIDILSGQGYEIDRPSELFLKSSKDNGKINIRVGGRASLVAEGKWF